MNKRLILSAAVATVLMGSAVFADLDSAKKYLETAKAKADTNDFDGANSELDLADAELDGAAGTDAVKKQVTDLRNTIKAKQNAGDHDILLRKLNRQLDDVKESIGNLVTWKGAESQFVELFDSDSAKALLTDAEKEDFNKKMATFRKVNAKKAGPQLLEQMKANVTDLETRWADNKKEITGDGGSKDSAITSAGRDLEQARKLIAGGDPDSSEYKALVARVDAVEAEYNKLALADKITAGSDQIKRYFESYKDEFDGWQNEQGGVTFAQYKAVSGDEKLSKFNYPKTVAYINRTNDFDKDILASEDVKPVINTPEIKAMADKIHASIAEAKAKVLKAATAVVNEGVKSKLDESGLNAMSRLKDDVRLALGEEDPDAKKLMAMCEKVTTGASEAAAGAEEAKKALITKLTGVANDSWANIEGKFKVEEGFDPNNPADFKGKYVKITTDNLMGYRFKPGDFRFATTLHGLPIAASFDPSLAKALDAIEAKIGRSVGDSDDDGKWEIIVLVTGTKGRLMQKKEGEGDLKVDGQTVGKVTTEYADPVDAPIVTIVAAKCGPFVGGKGTDTIKPDGTVGE